MSPAFIYKKNKFPSIFINFAWFVFPANAMRTLTSQMLNKHFRRVQLCWTAKHSQRKQGSVSSNTLGTKHSQEEWTRLYTLFYTALNNVPTVCFFLFCLFRLLEYILVTDSQFWQSHMYGILCIPSYFFRSWKISQCNNVFNNLFILTTFSYKLIYILKCK